MNILSRPKNRSLLERASVRVMLSPKVETKQGSSTSETYDEETDIMTIHKHVLDEFSKENFSVENLRKEVSKIREIINSSRLRIVDLRYYEDEIEKLEEQIRERSSDSRRQQYLQKVQEILQEWEEMKRLEGPYFKFGSQTRYSPDKISIIRAYLQVASEFVSLNLCVKERPGENLCPYCRETLGDEEGKVVCYKCGIYQDALTHDAEYNDRCHINSTSNNGYMNKETFVKALDCYQGRQKVEFPRELWTKFDDYCAFKKKIKATLNYETTRPIFKEIGYSGYFDDINLFLSMHPEIRKPLPDLSKVEDQILQDYDQFSAKYPEIKGDERDSSLNAWYLLYILCQRREVPCNKFDLKMPDTREIRISNDNIARKVFEALGWKFQDTI